jgi:hypothetical protein
MYVRDVRHILRAGSYAHARGFGPSTEYELFTKLFYTARGNETKGDGDGVGGKKNIQM